MTHITELRKDPRPANPAPEAQLPHSRQVPSTHISSYILKFPGLKPGEPRLEDL